MTTDPGPAKTPAPKKNTAGGLGCLVVLGLIVWAIATRGSTTPSAGGAPVAPPAATARPATAVLLELTGNGIKKSRPFSATGPWTLGYDFNCSGFANGTGNFIVTVFGTDGSLRDIAVNELAARGNSTTQGYETGQLYLEMNSECSWAVRVTG